MLSEQEFIAAIRTHEGIIHKVCILYQQEEDLRADLFQEIVLNAWKGISNFRAASKFSTWLYRVALNTAISFYRYNKKQVPVIGFDQLSMQLQTENPSPSYSRLYAAIGELSKVDKALVMLFLDEFSYAEIASFMGISENLVAVKMARIRKRLKTMIISQQIEE